MSNEQTINRTRNDLVVGGTGIIAFGVWSVVKTVMFVIVRADDILAPLGDAVSKAFGMAFLVVFTAVVLGISLSLRIVIGRSAIAEGKGAKKGSAYLVLAGILAVINVAGMALNVASLAEPETGILEAIAVLIVDVTVIFSLISTIVCAVRIRKMTKAEGGDGTCS